MARLHSPSHAGPRAHPSVLEGAGRAAFPCGTDMVGRRRHRGEVPRDLGLQLRARRRCRARSHAQGGRRRAAAGARRGRDGHVPRGHLPPGRDDRPARRALDARPYVVLGPGDGSDATSPPSRPPMCASNRLDAGPELWSRVGESLALFGNDPSVAGAAPEHRGGDVRGRAQAMARRPRRRGRRSSRWRRWCSWRASATWTTSPRSPRRAAAGWPPSIVARAIDTGPRGRRRPRELVRGSRRRARSSGCTSGSASGRSAGSLQPEDPSRTSSPAREREREVNAG